MAKNTDAMIKEAEASGQRNAETLRLFQNWCANAQIQRFGGVGIVEQMTGLPIGHMTITCDHAPTAGHMTYHLEKSAIHFYLRNCENCAKRSPVRLPNFSKIVAKHKDAEKQKQEQKAQVDARKQQELAARINERSELKELGTPTDVGLLNLLDEIDEHHDTDAKAALFKTIEMEPSKISEMIIGYFEKLITKEATPLQSTACKAILLSNANQQLKLTAAITEARYYTQDSNVFEIIQQNLTSLTYEDLKSVLPAIAFRAVPFRDHFGPTGQRKVPDNSLLKAAIETHAIWVEEEVARLLYQENEHDVSIAARILLTMNETGSTNIRTHFRSIIGLHVRASSRLPSLAEHSDALSILEELCVSLFIRFPKAIDELLQSFRQGATDENLVAIIKIYDRCPRNSNYDAPEPEIRECDLIAFDRLMWLAIDNFGDSDLMIRIGLFHGHPYKKDKLASLKFEKILGAIAVLDGRVQTLVSTLPKAKTNPDPWAYIELENQCQSGLGLLRSLVRWASIGTDEGGVTSIEELIEFYQRLPEESQNLRSYFISSFGILIKSHETRAVVLPHIYSALMGADQLLRGMAASTIKEIPRRWQAEFPDLLYQALLLSLKDPYKVVHQRAFDTLTNITIPTHHDAEYFNTITFLLLAYATDKEDSRFLSDCLREYQHLAAHHKRWNDTNAKAILEMLNQMAENEAADIITGLGKHIGHLPGYVRLLSKLLSSPNVYKGFEVMMPALNFASEEVIKKEANALVSACASFGTSKPYKTIEVATKLTQYECWNEAVLCLEQLSSQFGNTVRERLAKTQIALIREACEFEANLPQSAKTISITKSRWNELQNTLSQENEWREQQSPFPFL